LSNHVKRLAQPRRWKIPKQDHTWAPKPRPGPHAASDALPLVAAVRNLLEVADEAREAKQAVSDGRVLVDGTPCRDHRRALGFMDVVSIPDAEEHYRVLYDQHGRIALLAISEDDAESKLVRIEDKTVVEGGRTQLNLHDGRNVIVKEDDYATGDVIRITLPDQAIAEHFPREAGNPAYVTGGTHIGEIATVRDHTIVRSSSPNLITLEAETEFDTVEDYVFVLGEDEPAIDIPEVEFHA
jgi:small subunit ribosomal protein S4e